VVLISQSHSTLGICLILALEGSQKKDRKNEMIKI
jgi:hypothetical protein